jgi:phosphoglycerate kinase
VVAAGRVPEDLAALDIGPETARSFHEGIVQARTVLWSGPMGVHESEPFMAGTVAVARAVASTRGAFTIVTGGDTVSAVHRAGVAERISHISLGDGATLEYLVGHRLPALVALET